MQKDRTAYFKRYRELHKKQHRLASKKCRLAKLKEYKKTQQNWYKKNPGRNAELTRLWKKMNPLKVKKSRQKIKVTGMDRHYNAKHKYGLTKEQYEYILKTQKGKCAICKEIFKQGRAPDIDHCHKTKKVRGILCHPCNLALGGFRDTIKFLKSAIKYLGGING